MPRLLAALLASAALVVAPSAASAAAPRSIADAPVHTVKAGPGEVAYRTIGSGRPIVLIMGLSGTMDAWAPSFVDALAAGHHRVITFDNEGIRRSTKGKGPVTITRMADTTAALIRALRLRRPDVLGWSMGGMIAQSLAARHPKSLRRLVLAATAPGDAHATAPELAVLTALSNGSAFAGGGLMDLIFPPGQDAAAQRFAQQITRYPKAAPSAPAAVTQQQFAACATWILGSEPSGRALKRLRLPLLVAGGTLDRLLPFANDQHIAQTVPGARLLTYDGAGHGFLYQDEDQFVPQVVRFLR